MSSEIKLLNGAFTATLIKGENGKTTWKYDANLSRIGKKKIEKGNMKEKPQFKVIEDIEAASLRRFQESTKNTVLDITKFLKTLIK